MNKEPISFDIIETDLYIKDVMYKRIDGITENNSSYTELELWSRSFPGINRTIVAQDIHLSPDKTITDNVKEIILKVDDFLRDGITYSINIDNYSYVNYEKNNRIVIMDEEGDVVYEENVF